MLVAGGELGALVAGGELGAGGWVGAGLGAAGFTLAGLGGALGVGAGATEMLGTGGAAGTLNDFPGGAPLPVPGGELGALGKLLGGRDGDVSDFNATAVAAFGGGVEVVLGFGGPQEVVGAGPGAGAADGGRDTPALGPGGFGATEEVAGATGLGATEAVAAAGATDATGFGAGTDVLAAPGARDGVAAVGLGKSGGAGIDVSPVAGPGPSGATGCTGIVVDGPGGASSRQARPSASKLRSVFRPQIGQSHPTSNRFSCASMLCAGARSRIRSGPTAKPERT